jgi:hypothetical protein
MRNWIIASTLSLALVPATLLAATSDDAAKPKPVAKAKPEQTHKAKDKAQAKAQTAPKPVATYKRPSASAPMLASEPPLDPDRTAVAEQVHTGRMVCELGNAVHVTPDTQNADHFHVQMNKHLFHMRPVVSATGAIRLEDAQAGAMWLQLSNKSMLMNSKLGQRMADECQSPDQMAVAQAMKLAPPVSLLEGLNTGANLAKK